MSELIIDPSLIKRKLLHISQTNKFTEFSPQQLYNHQKEVTNYLQQHESSLNLIELYNLLELQFYLNILTNNDEEAKIVLNKIISYFNEGNETKIVRSQRLKFLKSIWYESQNDLKKSMEMLNDEPDELKLSRRLTTFARNHKGNNDTSKNSNKYIDNLIYYLNLQPNDILTWKELSEEYLISGNYDKSIYCLKQVLLIQPKAYPIFYKIGLIYYYKFLNHFSKLNNLNNDKKDKLIELLKIFKLSRDNYLISLEINQKFDKSWVGLKTLINLNFDSKLIKVSENNKEIKEFIKDNEKIKVIVDKQIKELNIEI
ncbi:oca3 [Candida pseudojiufengensis]|uniref:oca3 n=1 Tax=Candida pseudojiufengensis TaxID=497109 RepID=UPI002224C5EC|nr:oca3 [Candida pseudojiufengensis]KAI5967809.1 oca3 [Candida pseudojiufengensis]